MKHRYNSFFPYFLTLQLSFKTEQPFACMSRNIDNIKWNKHVTVNQRISSYERRIVMKHREYEASRYFGNWNCKKSFNFFALQIDPVSSILLVLHVSLGGSAGSLGYVNFIFNRITRENLRPSPGLEVKVLDELLPRLSLYLFYFP